MSIAAKVRTLKSSEWPAYRTLRLRALAESPDAFGSTLAAEQGRPEDDWAARVATGATSGRDLPLVVEVHGKAAGIAWARFDASNASLVNVYQMWVVPEFRRQGLGRQLLRAAVEWARAQRAGCVCLRVTSGDTPATRLYAREGFKPEGEREPLRPGSSLLSQPMKLALNEDAV